MAQRGHLAVLPTAARSDREFTFTTAPSISKGNSSRESPRRTISALTSSTRSSTLCGMVRKPWEAMYSRVSLWDAKVRPSASWRLNTRISSSLLAQTLGSSWRREPAAALRGLAKRASPFSSRWRLSLWKTFFGMKTSPRTMSRGSLSGSVMGMDLMVRRFSVTSSPTRPSPRVAP